MSIDILPQPDRTAAPPGVDTWNLMEARLRTAQAGDLVDRAIVALRALDRSGIEDGPSAAMDDAESILLDASRAIVRARRELERRG